jgi:DNA (cytosine-5)-methyltransferase 1
MAGPDRTKPTIIDLFAGVGGYSLGAVRAGFDLSLAVEWDKHALQAHKLNFPGFNHLDADISKLDGKKLLAAAGLHRGQLDGLIGGPPCQGFSTMGARDKLDPRNALFVHFFRLVHECSPRFFVVENVLGILDAPYKAIRQRALKLVQEEYHVLPPLKLKASDYGAPTTRERVFFVGYRKNLPIRLSEKDFEVGKAPSKLTVSRALKGLPTRIHPKWLTEQQSWRQLDGSRHTASHYYWSRILGDIPEGVGHKESLRRYSKDRVVSGCFGTRHTAAVKARLKRLKPGRRDATSKAVRLAPDGLCPTLRAGTGPDKGSYQAIRPIHPTADRVITPREAARLQGFPDWFQFAPSKWQSFRQIGNSVSPILAEAVLGTMLTGLDQTRRSGEDDKVHV